MASQDITSPTLPLIQCDLSQNDGGIGPLKLLPAMSRNKFSKRPSPSGSVPVRALSAWGDKELGFSDVFP